MPRPVVNPEIRERRMFPMSGWLALVVGLGLIAFGVLRFISLVVGLDDGAEPSTMFDADAGIAVAAVLVGVFVLNGLFTMEPNEAVVLTFFGSYRGSVRADGLRWVAPVYRRTRLSLRLRNLNGDVLKVNDLDGNPIEISAVVVWHVGDTARARFGVENYQSFVEVQSESAVRELAQRYAYDGPSGDSTLTLRGGGSAISDALSTELQDRLDPSGVVVTEARVNHLAYAPEIASAMLRRQQAQAVIDARARIVEGSVGIARSAVEQLRTDPGFTLSGADAASLASNLLVVLCSETDAIPTISL